MGFLLGKLSWPEVAEILEKTDFVIIPVGSLEQHGRHLPLDNDTHTAFEVSVRLAKHLEGRLNILVAPPIPYGVSGHHMDFPGTVTIGSETLTKIIVEVCLSLHKHGFKRFLILNGHGGNTCALRLAVRKLVLEHGVEAYAVNWWETVKDVVTEIYGVPITHADEGETAVAYALNQRVVAEEARGSGTYGKKTQVYTVKPMKEYTSTGSLGHPEKATKKHGEKIVSIAVERLAQELIKITGK